MGEGVTCQGLTPLPAFTYCNRKLTALSTPGAPLPLPHPPRPPAADHTPPTAPAHARLRSIGLLVERPVDEHPASKEASPGTQFGTGRAPRSVGPSVLLPPLLPTLRLRLLVRRRRRRPRLPLPGQREVRRARPWPGPCRLVSRRAADPQAADRQAKDGRSEGGGSAVTEVSVGVDVARGPQPDLLILLDLPLSRRPQAVYIYAVSRECTADIRRHYVRRQHTADIVSRGWGRRQTVEQGNSGESREGVGPIARSSGAVWSGS